MNLNSNNYRHTRWLRINSTNEKEPSKKLKEILQKKLEKEMID